MKRVMLCVLAAALLVSASAGAARTTTVAQYRAQTNAICAREDTQLNALSSDGTLATYLVEALGVARTAYNSLARLTPPDSLKAVHTALVANIKAGFPIVEALEARAKKGKLTIAQFEANAALSANVAKENALWKKIGAAKCLS